MTIKGWSLWVGLGLVANAPASAQGTFQNLDFENGTFIPISGDPFGRVQFGAALPGWTGYIGTQQIDWVLYNNLFLSEPGLAIFGSNYPTPGLFHGEFFVVLQDSFSTPSIMPALAQTGMIPATAQRIQMLSNNPYMPGFTLLFQNQPIPLQYLGDASNGRAVWGGDISAYAGQTGELRFVGGGYLDHIQFSSEPIPEPNAVALFLMGTACWFAWRRRRLWT
jgi:hypothetical protein